MLNRALTNADYRMIQTSAFAIFTETQEVDARPTDDPLQVLTDLQEWYDDALRRKSTRSKFDNLRKMHILS